MDINFNGVADSEETMSKGVDIERIRAAKKRRSIQLKKWNQYDKAKEKEEQLKYKKGYPSLRKSAKIVRFNQNLILLEAGFRGDIDEVRRLLSGGVCADASNDDGLTALHQAAINNNIDLCHLLVQHGANVNVKDKELWTPLHAAAVFGHKEICFLLIKNGADLMALNGDGNMPYDICEDDETLDEIEGAMSRRNITQEQINNARLEPEKKMIADIKSLLGRHQLSTVLNVCTQLDKQGATMLHITAANGWAEATKMLLEQVGVPPDPLDRDGWQPIHVGAFYGHMSVVEVLVSHGADLDALTAARGMNALDGETVYELVDDQDIYDQLLVLRREVDRIKAAAAAAAAAVNQQDSIIQPGSSNTFSALGGLGPGIAGSVTPGVSSSFGLVRRRSSTNPRSASIRRTSMKEKSNLSWKEARQEAEIRRSLERKKPEENGVISQESNTNNNTSQQNGNGVKNNISIVQSPPSINGQYNHKQPSPNTRRITDTIHENDTALNENSNNNSTILSKARTDFKDAPNPSQITASNPSPRNNNNTKPPRLITNTYPQPPPQNIAPDSARTPSSNQGRTNSNAVVSTSTTTTTPPKPTPRASIQAAVAPSKLRKSQENLAAMNHHHRPAPPPSNKYQPPPLVTDRSSQLSTRSTNSTVPRSSQESLRLRQQILYGNKSGGPPTNNRSPINPSNKSKNSRPESCCLVM